ncbi:hypothetical protein MLD38_019403 [Melastoma candidum]|uniref:Uncharacterized protein n=1 Tax=Melastoma candidum TaxID=119954 RepID=A0ACB9R564_9MYRT|nr:hypothetical protein MLD38_019403 [Melastoma candidum]
MARGRKLTSSRSAYLLGSYNNGQGYGSVVDDASELGEDDVWSAVDGVTVDDGDEDDVRTGNYRRASAESIDIVSGRSRNIPRGHHRRGDASGLSLAFEDPQASSRRRIVHQFRGGGDESPRGRQQQHGMATSAPVDVPDWSKIYRVSSMEFMNGTDEAWMDDRESEMVPPHEYLARVYARSRESAADSVFEGVGRTLKGRDMRRVRDAVWSQTGFDG